MKNNKFFSALIIVCLFLLVSVSGLLINTFTDSLTSENLTFSESENLTRYLSVPRYSNITSAYMNLSGHSGIPSLAITGEDWIMFHNNLNNSGYTTNNFPENISKEYATFSLDSNIYNTPTTKDDYVYALDFDGKLYQLNSFNVSNEIASYQMAGHSRVAPAVANGYVYAGDDTPTLYQLNASNVSQLIAQFDSYNRLGLGLGFEYSSPAVTDKYVYLGGEDYYVHQLNASNVSQEIASYETSYIIYESPTVANGYLYIGNFLGTFYQLNASNISQEIAVLWRGSSLDYVYGSSTATSEYVYIGDDSYSSGFLVLQVNASDINQTFNNFSVGGGAHEADWNTPVVANGYVYIGNNNNNVYQLNATNMSLVNIYETDSDVRGLSITENYLFAQSYDGYLYQLNATNISTLIDKVDLSGGNEGGVSIANGFVYAGAGSKVYQLGEGIESNLQNLSLEIGTPDGTHEWNFTGVFNETFSPNKTLDLSSSINSALDNGACTGGILNGNNCTINFTFHSDSAGLLEYSVINIQYTPAPFITLESPGNDTHSPAIRTFNCSATDEIQLSNITFYFWNSTGLLNLSTTIDLTGTSNSTTYNMTFNSTDTYTWGCSAYNNNSRERWADDNFTINVDIDDPIVTLNAPTDLQYINTQNVQFNYTPEHSTQTIGSCQLYGNFTGAWLFNQSNSSSITEDIINVFNQTLPDNYYSWNINCSTIETGNTAFSNSNFTFTLDTVYPSVTIDSITTTAGLQTFSFLNTVSDSNLDSCKYSIFDSDGNIDGLNENVSFVCGIATEPTTTAYGNYNLTIYAVDLAGNENSSILSFTTSASTGETVGGGGAPPSVDNIPVIAIKQIVGEKLYNELERAIFYARINTFCSIKKASQPLAIQDFSGECSLKKTDIEDIRNEIFLEGIDVPVNDLILFYEKYNGKELEQIYMTIDIVETYDLFTSVLGITNPMMVNPPRLDRPFIIFGDGNITIKYTFVVNKKIKECSIISGDGFECEVATDNSVIMTLYVNDTNFFDKAFSGEMSITSDAEPENIEIKRISLLPRVYNLSYRFFGIPVIVFIVFLGVLILVISVFLIVRGKIRKNLKGGKS